MSCYGPVSGKVKTELQHGKQPKSARELLHSEYVEQEPDKGVQLNLAPLLLGGVYCDDSVCVCLSLLTNFSKSTFSKRNWNYYLYYKYQQQLPLCPNCISLGYVWEQWGGGGRHFDQLAMRQKLRRNSIKQVHMCTSELKFVPGHRKKILTSKLTPAYNSCLLHLCGMSASRSVVVLPYG